LVAVHGQSDQHRLLRPEAQREALDAFAGVPLEEILGRYRADHARLREVEHELREVLGSARERAREADVLRLGLEEIEALDPVAGEETDLAAEEARLGHADTLREAAEAAREALSSDQDAPDALGAVAAARQALEGVRDHDPEAASLAGRVAEVSYLLADVAADVASYATGLETDPGRLAVVSERRAALTGLTRKYGETVAEVLEWGREASQRLLRLDGSDERIVELRADRLALRAQLAVDAAELGRLRREAAGRLASAVSAELGALSMPHARLEVVLDRTPDERGLAVDGGTWHFGAHGVDDVTLLLAANTGSEPRPLGKGASGGELSRVMLALEVTLAGTRPVPTFVFDEVDAGVGGKAAVEIGRRLAVLARTSQVLVVTHLPRSRRTPTGTSWSARAATGASPPPVSRCSTTPAGCASSPGCSPAWSPPTPRWPTHGSCSTWPSTTPTRTPGSSPTTPARLRAGEPQAGSGLLGSNPVDDRTHRSHGEPSW
jgi:DNA repair protein RecN (Recombination protein N)